jgi:repressor LexA
LTGNRERVIFRTKVLKMKELSQKQQSILRFIDSFSAEKGYPPSMREIVRGCHISSTSVVEYHLNILQREGYIRRDPEVARGIELRREQKTSVPVPVIGYIAAGEPVPVPAADTWDSVAVETLELPWELTRAKEKVYALKVRGTSMIDALINDGDLVIMQQVNTAEDGDTVAAWLKAEREITLKKLYRERGRLRLQPANLQMQPIYTDPDNVEIQGKVIGVIRQLD